MPTFYSYPHHDYYDVILTATEFNNWIAVINTLAASRNPHTPPHKAFLLLEIKSEMLDYGKIEQDKNLAHIRLRHDEILMIQTALSELSPHEWKINVKDYFSSILSDPDARTWHNKSNSWEKFLLDIPLGHNLPESAINYLHHWRDLGIPVDTVLLAIVFKKGATPPNQLDESPIDWDRMNSYLETLHTSNPNM